MKKYLLLILLFNCQPKGEFEIVDNNQSASVASTSEELRLDPTVYFAYDSSALSASARKKLQNNLLWLQSIKKPSLVIEGHCDERGTREYNLALGERRAYALARFFINAGISSDRIKVVSYGEERPAALGIGEAVYRLNRRAEIKVK